jgi:hypothetical protein
MDSTTVIVEPGPMVTNSFSGTTFFTFTSPATFAPDLLKDQYGNAVSYTFVVNGPAHVAGLSGSDARTLIADKDGVGTVDVMAEGRIVASGKLTAGSDSSRAWITLEF